MISQQAINGVNRANGLRQISMGLVLLMSIESWALEITGQTGSSTQTQTTIGLNSPSYAEVKGISKGQGNRFQYNFTINQNELISLRKLKADKTFQASSDTDYLLQIKQFDVCLVSTNEEGLYVKVNNQDLSCGSDSSAKIKTFVEFVGNGQASRGTGAQRIWSVSLGNGQGLAETYKFLNLDITGDTLNTLSPLKAQLSDSSPVSTLPINSTNYLILVASDTMQLFNHFATIQGALPLTTASTSSAENSRRFVRNKTSYADHSCGVDNSAVVTVAMYVSIKDLMNIEAGQCTASANFD